MINQYQRIRALRNQRQNIMLQIIVNNFNLAKFANAFVLYYFYTYCFCLFCIYSDLYGKLRTSPLPTSAIKLTLSLLSLSTCMKDVELARSVMMSFGGDLYRVRQQQQQPHMAIACSSISNNNTLHCNNLQCPLLASKSGVLLRGQTNFCSLRSKHVDSLASKHQQSRSIHSWYNCRSIKTSSTQNMSASDEAAKAQTADPTKETIFGMMLSGKIPAKFIYEDEQCVAFDDINPTGMLYM